MKIPFAKPFSFIEILSLLKALSYKAIVHGWKREKSGCAIKGVCDVCDVCGMEGMSTLSSVTGDSFKSFKLRLFSNNELASFTIVFDRVVFFFHTHKRFRLFHFLERRNRCQYGHEHSLRFISLLSFFLFFQLFFLMISAGVCSFLFFTLYRLNVPYTFITLERNISTNRVVL